MSENRDSIEPCCVCEFQKVRFFQKVRSAHPKIPDFRIGVKPGPFVSAQPDLGVGPAYLQPDTGVEMARSQKGPISTLKIRRLPHQNEAGPYRHGDFHTQKPAIPPPKSGWALSTGPDFNTRIWLGPIRKARFPHPKSCDFTTKIWLGPIKKARFQH